MVSPVMEGMFLQGQTNTSSQEIVTEKKNCQKRTYDYKLSCITIMVTFVLRD